MPGDDSYRTPVLPGNSDLARVLEVHREEIISEWVDGLGKLPGRLIIHDSPAKVISWAGNWLDSFIRLLKSESDHSIESFVEGINDLWFDPNPATSDIVLSLLLFKEAAAPHIISSGLDGLLPLPDAVASLDKCIRLVADRYLLHNGRIGKPYQTAESVLAAHDLPHVIKIVRAQALRLTGANDSVVLLVGEDESVAAAHDLGKESGGVEELFRSIWPGSDQLLPDKPIIRNRFNDTDRSALIAPLWIKSKPIGALLLINIGREFSPDDCRVIEMFAEWAAAAIEYARLSEQHEHLVVLEERQKLSRDLHDSVSQSLYAVSLYAEASIRLLSESQVSRAVENLEELRDTALAALREMRLLVFELRPRILEGEGLIATLRARLAAVEERVGLKAEFVCGEMPHLSKKLQEGLYCIAREALNNALKHASADSISVGLRQRGSRIVMEIVDNGRGFDPEENRKKGGLGLLGMDERVRQLRGVLEVKSSKGSGTCVTVEVPVNGDL